MSRKTPNPTDRHIGERVRARRLQVGWTQEKLGAALKLTFQQVQKYEKGTNRIGGSRMQQIAQALQCDVSWFFEGAPTTFESAGPGAKSMPPASDLSTFFTLPYSTDLAFFYRQLSNQDRRVVHDVAAALAQGYKPRAALLEASRKAG